MYTQSSNMQTTHVARRLARLQHFLQLAGILCVIVTTEEPNGSA